MDRIGFGVAANVPHDVLAELGRALAGLAYDDAWSNDFPGADGLDALVALGSEAPLLRLGLGVAALDRRPPPHLAAAVAQRGLGGDRLGLGVGAGYSRSPIEMVRAGIVALRRLLPDGTRIGAAAMGPRMCRLAGGLADFVLLNWMTPERIRWAARRVRSGAEEAGRDPGPVEIAAYVRVATGPDAAQRLGEEAARYASMPHYGRHFAAMGFGPGVVGVASADPSGVRVGLAPYREVLDTLVVRGLPSAPTLEAHLEIATAAI